MLRLGLACAACVYTLCVVRAQIQFELPAEMLQGGYGGMQQQREPEPPKAQWPSHISSRIDEAYSWVGNTEWKGKTAKYGLLRDGSMESTLKECKTEGSCAWSINSKGRMYINTPTLGV